MKKITLTLFSLMVVAATMQAQTSDKVKLNDFRVCGFQQLFDRSHVSYSDLIQSYRKANAARAAKGAKETDDVIYDVPVVFHIVYNNASFNIDDSIINNQLDILNKAYRKQHADTGLVRSYFKPFSADAHIQFHLATVDPDGNPTTGITRTYTAMTHFGTSDFANAIDSLERVKHTSSGGVDAWPADHYLNVWICNMSDASGGLSILGYGVPPLDPLPSNWPASDAAGLTGLGDGVVIQVHAVGSNSPLNAALEGIYSKGRAMVHEIGHYLGLQHVFGGSNGDSATAVCSSLDDDGIDDTPEQCTYSFDAHSGTSCPPDTKNSCGEGTDGDLPDMWEDYMDYAHDACQTMFTTDQVTIMRGVCAGQRTSLFWPLAVSNPAAAANGIAVFPNPASHTLNVRYAGQVNKAVISNILGQSVLQFDGNAAARQSYDISSLPAGNYFISIESNETRTVARFTIAK